MAGPSPLKIILSQMEISKRTRAQLGLAIVAMLSFSRVSQLHDIRTVDLLLLMISGASLGALITLLVQKKSE